MKRKSVKQHLDLFERDKKPVCMPPGLRADGVVSSSEAQKQDLELAQLPFHDLIVRRLDSLEAAFGSESESDRKANYVPA